MRDGVQGVGPIHHRPGAVEEDGVCTQKDIVGASQGHREAAAGELEPGLGTYQ